MVQGDFPISLSVQKADEQDIFLLYMAQSRRFVGDKLDLLVWPETMLPTRFDEPWQTMVLSKLQDHPDLQDYVADLQRMQGEMAAMLGDLHVPMMAGTLRYRSDGPDGEPELLNSAVLYESAGPDGRTLRNEGAYDKMHLVPFSEYVPFGRSWPAFHKLLRSFVPAEMPQLDPGNDVHCFTIHGAGGSWTFATPICYEGVFDRVCRRMCYSQGAKRADILVNISNDGWFIAQWPGRTYASSELDQHLSAYVFRAIENRVPVVRAVNTGISGFIDSNGRIQEVVQRDGRRKMVVGSARRQVLVDSRRSVYSLVGDWPAAACAAAALTMMAVLWRKNRYVRKEGAENP